MRTLSATVVALLLLVTSGTGAAGAEPGAPTTTEALLAGMVTEEVEPGVYKVVNDGYREVSHRDGAWSDAVIVGDVGDIWRITPPRRLFKLGQEEEWSYDPGLVSIGKDNTEATRDGRLWTVAVPDEYRIFDGEAWGYPTVEFGQHYDTLATQADGTVWLMAEDAHLRVLRGGDDVDISPSWMDAYDGDDDWAPPRLAVTDAGEAWLVGRGGSDNYLDFLRFDGDAWQVVPPPIGTAAGPQAYWSWDVGPDGTMWTVGDSLELHESLARLDDEGWTIFTKADGVRPWGEQPMGWWGTDIVRVAPDGSAWVNATDESRRTCDGLARFDGESWNPFLTGRCISDLDFAPDGSVWVVAHEPDFTSEVDTYVITPEAVEGTE